MGECPARAQQRRADCRLHLVFDHRPGRLGQRPLQKRRQRQSARTLRFESKHPRRRSRLQATDCGLAQCFANAKRLPACADRFAHRRRRSSDHRDSARDATERHRAKNRAFVALWRRIMRFTGKVAIITGAASGIGLATARRLAAEGASIVIADLNGDKARDAAASVAGTTKNSVIGIACDVSNEMQVETTVAETLRQFNGLDVVVNNAGLMIFKPLEQQTGEDWRRVLNVDLLGAFFFTKQAFLHMRRGGSIINVSSIHAVETTPLVSAYAAAKAAVVSLTRSSSLEGQAKGIRVNAILPGAVDTPMLWENPNVKSGLEQIDRGVLGKPEDIAAAIAFLAADESEFVRGSSVIVDGGRLGKL